MVECLCRCLRMVLVDSRTDSVHFGRVLLTTFCGDHTGSHANKPGLSDYKTRWCALFIFALRLSCWASTARSACSTCTTSPYLSPLPSAGSAT